MTDMTPTLPPLPPLDGVDISSLKGYDQIATNVSILRAYATAYGDQCARAAVADEVRRGAVLGGVKAEIHESSPTLIRATFREPSVREYELEASRDDVGDRWYIKVIGEDGLHTYDGYWMRSERKTQAEVIVEAAHGSCLGENAATPPAVEARVPDERKAFEEWAKNFEPAKRAGRQIMPSEAWLARATYQPAAKDLASEPTDADWADFGAWCDRDKGAMSMLEQLIDVWGDGQLPYEHRCYVDGTWGRLIADAKAMLSAAPAAPQASDDVLSEEIERLQKSLAFWMPGVPAPDHPLHKRVADDAYLLVGYDGPNNEPSAFDLGHVAMATYPPTQQDRRIAFERAIEALDELEAAARGDEPFPHFAGPLIRQTLAAHVQDPCDVPPSGWYCTREKGHDGPCAAHPAPKQVDAQPPAEIEQARPSWLDGGEAAVEMAREDGLIPPPTVDVAARELGKWLRERPNRPIDLECVAVLVHYAQASAQGEQAQQASAQPTSAPADILTLARAVIKAREVYGWSVEADAAIRALEVALQGAQPTQAAKPMSDDEVENLRAAASYKTYITRQDYFKAFRDAEAATAAKYAERIADLQAKLDAAAVDAERLRDELAGYKAVEAANGKWEAAKQRAEDIISVLFPTYSAVAARTDPSVKPLQWHEKSWWWNGASIQWHESEGFDVTGGEVVIESYVGGGETERITIHIPLAWIEAPDDQWIQLVHQHKKKHATHRKGKARAAELAEAEREIERAKATLKRLGAIDAMRTGEPKV